MDDTVALIKKQVQEHVVLLYMKGTPASPQCGFSARVVELLMGYGIRFAFVNILDHPHIRNTLPDYAQWPTFPQLWVNGELVGGCDIVTEMHERATLKPLLDKHAPAPPVEG